MRSVLFSVRSWCVCVYWLAVFPVVWGYSVCFWTGTFEAASVVDAVVRTAAVLQLTLIDI